MPLGVPSHPSVRPSLPAVLTFKASEKAGEVTLRPLPELGLWKRSATRACSSPRASGHRSIVASSPPPLRGLSAPKCASSVG